MTQIEIDVDIFFKSKKKVWVKPTATKKGHYREMEVGRKEGDKPFSDPAKKIIVGGAKERLTESMKNRDNATKHLQDLETWKGTEEYKNMPDNEGIYRVQKESWTNELDRATRSMKESRILIDKFSG